MCDQEGRKEVGANRFRGIKEVAMKKMTRLEAEKIVARLSAMTQKDMVKAMTEGEEFHRLHDELLANGWATLTEGMKRHKDGKIVCKMRLVRGDDPEWLRLKPTW